VDHFGDHRNSVLIQVQQIQIFLLGGSKGLVSFPTTPKAYLDFNVLSLQALLINKLTVGRTSFPP
jgi:hypothetical protein